MGPMRPMERTATRLRLRTELARVGLSPRALAVHLGCDEDTVRRYLSAERPIPEEIKALIRSFAHANLGRSARGADLFRVERVPVLPNGELGGAHLRMCRLLDNRDVTLYELAAGAGLARSSLSQISRGRQRPTPAQRAAVEGWLRDHTAMTTEELAEVWLPEDRPPQRRGATQTIQPEDQGEEITMLDPAVLAHFGLRRDPFRNEIAASGDLFWGRNYAAAEAALVEAARRKEFAALVGEVGIGKTLVRKHLEERLHRDARYRILVPPSPSREAMGLRSVEESLIRELAPTATVRSSIDARARQLRELLEHCQAEEQTCVVLLDEAHAFPNRTLRSFKRLLELSGFARLMGIILIGQPELLGTLRDPAMREVGRRCNVIELAGLARTEVGPYLKFKVERAGGKAAIFADSAVGALTLARRRENIDRLLSHARIPLSLGNKAARALVIAHATGAKQVNGEHVEEAFSG